MSAVSQGVANRKVDLNELRGDEPEVKEQEQSLSRQSSSTEPSPGDRRPCCFTHSALNEHSALVAMRPPAPDGPRRSRR